MLRVEWLRVNEDRVAELKRYGIIENSNVVFDHETNEEVSFVDLGLENYYNLSGVAQ